MAPFKESSDDNTEDDGEGKRKRTDTQAFTPDPGQEFIRRAGRIVGFDANIHIRWYRRDGSPDAYEGTVTVSGFTKGGAVTDLEPFNFKLNGQGAPVEIPNPIAATLAAEPPATSGEAVA